MQLHPDEEEPARPGHQHSLRAEKSDALAQLLFEQTTTIGVRIYEARRKVLEREHGDRGNPLRHGARSKWRRRDGKVLNAAPEFDDCQRLATEKSVPLKQVIARRRSRLSCSKVQKAAQRHEERFSSQLPSTTPTPGPHVGSAYTTIVCDVLARYKRMCGYDVAFLTGTDEHGEKLERAAAAAGSLPSEFVAEKRKLFVELWEKLGIPVKVYPGVRARIRCASSIPTIPTT